MKKLFSTHAIPTPDRFSRWREFCSSRFAPMSYTSLGDETFDAVVEGTNIGGLAFTRAALGSVKVASTSRTKRFANNTGDMLWITLKLSGTMLSEQDGRSMVQKPGDFSVYDPNGTFVLAYPSPIKQLMIQLPRERLEGMLGSARNFTGLAVHSHLPTTSLLRSFLRDLVNVHEQLAPEAAERMTSICVDLIVASIAERMALESPKPLQGTLTVQRAKAYVEANLGDAGLDSPTLAAVVGVSMRRLQELFQERGCHISDWIWGRRLEVAAQRLADPGSAHLPVSGIAYGCGFVNQGHFASRFKDRFGMTPTEYRRHSSVVLVDG